MNIYNKILYLLNERKLTQNQMIRELELGKNAMVHWRKDNNIPTGETLLKLSCFFKVPVDFILDNVDSYLSEDFIKELDLDTLCKMHDLVKNELIRRQNDSPIDNRKE